MTQLRRGDRIAITDVDADTVEAEVLDVAGQTAHVQLRTDRILRHS